MGSGGSVRGWGVPELGLNVLLVVLGLCVLSLLPRVVAARPAALRHRPPSECLHQRIPSSMRKRSRRGRPRLLLQARRRRR